MVPSTPAATRADSEEEEGGGGAAAGADVVAAEDVVGVGDKGCANCVLGRPVVGDEVEGGGAEVCHVAREEERKIEVVIVTVVVGPMSVIMGGIIGVAISTEGSVVMGLVDGPGDVGGEAAVTGMVDQPLVSVESGTVVTGAVFQAFGSVESEKVVTMLRRGLDGLRGGEVTADP